MAGAGAVAPAAAAPQAHLGTPLACLPAHLPVPTAREAELLRRMDALTINTSPECMQLSEREKQLLRSGGLATAAPRCINHVVQRHGAPA